MTGNIRSKIESALNLSVQEFHPLSGGDAASAWRVRMENGPLYFAKSVSGDSPFEMEALGLRRLRCQGGVRVPEVIAVQPGLLLLEWIERAPPRPEYQIRLGEQLATTHLGCTHDQYGFDQDHVIGSTPQKNQPWVPAESGAWARFWWTHRLEPMFKRLNAPGLIKKGLALSDKLPDLLVDPGESPSLLHGDLWSGNITADRQGHPVMFDPAPYYGYREAELGMTRMFGGFTPDFYQAYTRTAPLPDGWEDRLDLYTL
ncbi:MAG: fructosamine kinase family protein, partial [Kiritimatiellae bacterium]|nr:fructosamine kinase family protein [Kiritimatiellia bacterium]